jgi:hypothetical protein
MMIKLPCTEESARVAMRPGVRRDIREIFENTLRAISIRGRLREHDEPIAAAPNESAELTHRQR